MSTNEKSLVDEKQPNEVVRDEVSDLLELYNLEKLSKDAIKIVLEKHYAQFGRVGFDSTIDENNIDTFYRHLTRNTKEYLQAEQQFISEIIEGDVNQAAELGLARAMTLFPEQEYKKPQIVILINGAKTDAKVLGNNQFGINLQNLFKKVYSSERQTYDTLQAYKIILSNCAHETTHLLEEQIEHTDIEKVNWAIRGTFSEGLATFAEEEFHYPWSEDYLNDSTTTIEIIKKLNPNITETEKAEVLKSLCDMGSLQKHRGHDLQQAHALLELEEITLKDFERVVIELLVHQNGPLYYAGYAVWKRIYETEGLEKIKQIVKKGPKSFSEYM